MKILVESPDTVKLGDQILRIPDRPWPIEFTDAEPNEVGLPVEDFACVTRPARLIKVAMPKIKVPGIKFLLGDFIKITN